jgi:hypothetical protein
MSAKQLGCCALLRVLLASALGATDLSGVCLDGFQLRQIYVSEAGSMQCPTGLEAMRLWQVCHCSRSNTTARS